MADHRRKVIRDDFVAALTGLTTTGSRVYKSRTMPLDDDNLPGMIVYTGSEEIDIEAESRVARIQERALNIIVEAYDKLPTGLDDNLDKMVAEVETAIFSGAIDTVSTIDLAAIDEPEIENGLEQPVGRVKMTFRVQYLTADGAPTIAI